MVPEKWPEIEKLVVETEDKLKATTGNMSQEEAAASIDTMQQRAAGAVGFQARPALLACHPAFIAAPALEFKKGFTTSFSAKDHPEAGGFDLTVKFPASWAPAEIPGDTTIQKWTCDAGFGKDVGFLVLTKLDAPLDGKELEAMFSETIARTTLGKDMNVVSFSAGKSKARSVGIIEVSDTVETENTRQDLHGQIFYVIVGERIVIFNFFCYSDPGSGLSKKRYEQLKPLIKFITDSIVVQDP